ncbi:Interleukin-17 receptor B [Saguinus oedipus]|uniref:Interleukin-17 receptor B n=1 Tax=Saguinus oedipus TaxID=9490 RepID=A0ABQ9U3I8_SAGOE|nr:Interleukin-17 receptor B [Saguinus oedipus]
MSLVLLSLVALCRSAVPREPILTSSHSPAEAAPKECTDRRLEGHACTLWAAPDIGRRKNGVLPNLAKESLWFDGFNVTLTIQCGSETGPSPEWMLQHDLTPGDLKDLRVETVKTNVATGDYSILMNISWVLRADASIRLLKATKICVTGKSNFQSHSCVRCNYTEAFQTQTRPSGGKWTFSYIGFPVELNTVYFIGAHNIPNANMNEDGPTKSVNFTSPGKLPHSFIILCLAGMPTLG